MTHSQQQIDETESILVNAIKSFNWHPALSETRRDDDSASTLRPTSQPPSDSKRQNFRPQSNLGLTQTGYALIRTAERVNKAVRERCRFCCFDSNAGEFPCYNPMPPYDGLPK